jgi:hypothetical protein
MGWGNGLRTFGNPFYQVRASGKVTYIMLPKRPLSGGLTKDNPAAINPRNLPLGGALGREPQARWYARAGS